MHPETIRRLELDGGSLELRRRSGPTAWVVFEELLLISTGPADACEATVSVRTLAARLGFAKDTVSRALTALRRAGLVTVSQERTTCGVFATGRYRLHVPDSITVTDHTTTPTAIPTALATRSTTRTRTARRPHPTVQLALAIES
jgi:DNA-binding transcriptional ArsR family regulator